MDHTHFSSISVKSISLSSISVPLDPFAIASGILMECSVEYYGAKKRKSSQRTQQRQRKTIMVTRERKLFADIIHFLVPSNLALLFAFCL